MILLLVLRLFLQRLMLLPHWLLLLLALALLPLLCCGLCLRCRLFFCFLAAARWRACSSAKRFSAFFCLMKPSFSLCSSERCASNHFSHFLLNLQCFNDSVLSFNSLLLLLIQQFVFQHSCFLSTVALSSFCCSSNSLLALIIVETA